MSSSPRPIDWSQTTLRELVDFIGPRLGCRGERDGFMSLLVFHALNLRQWPGVCVYFKDPVNGVNVLDHSMLEHDGQCLSFLGSTLEQCISRYCHGGSQKELVAFYPNAEENLNYCKSVAASNPGPYARIQKALDAFSVEIAARKLAENTQSSAPVRALRTPRL